MAQQQPGQYGGPPQQQQQQQAPYAGAYANAPPQQQQPYPQQQQGYAPQQQQQYQQQQQPAAGYGQPAPYAPQQAGYAPQQPASPPPQQQPQYNNQQYAGNAPPPAQYPQQQQQQAPPGQWQQQAPPPPQQPAGYGPPPPAQGQYPSAHPPQQQQQYPQQQQQQPYPAQQAAYGNPPPPQAYSGGPAPPQNAPPYYGSAGGSGGPLPPPNQPPRGGPPPPGGFGLDSEVGSGGPRLPMGPPSGGNNNPPLINRGGNSNSSAGIASGGGGGAGGGGVVGSGGGFGLDADIGRGQQQQQLQGGNMPPPQLNRGAQQQQVQQQMAMGGVGSLNGAMGAPQVGGFGLEAEVGRGGNVGAGAGQYGLGADLSRANMGGGGVVAGGYGLQADLSRANMGGGGGMGGGYGLEAEAMASHMQRMNLGPTQQGGQQYSPPRQAAPPPPLFTLDQLPPDQRVVHLTKAQANDLVQQLAIEAAHGNAAPPRVLDLADAHKHLIDSMTSKTYAYINTVELSAPDKRLPLNARASLLQAKLKHGHNRLQDLVQPTLEPGQQAFVDLAFTPDGALLEESARVWQCGLTLVRAEGIGPTGLKHSRQACLHVARLALFDRARNRFLGNVLGLRPDAVTNRDTSWQFRLQDRVVIRCNCVQPDPRTGTRLVNDDALSIYIEFNTSHKLDIADTKNMPPHEHRAAKMVDEVTTCWAMLNFRRCCQAARDQEASVPLYYGSLYSPQSLDALYKIKRRKNPLSAVFKPKHTPTLIFKAGPLAGEPPPLLPYGFMPSTMLALDDLAWALGAYRVVMGLQLARQQTPFSALADPVLASFPRLLGDNHLLTEFLVKWKDALIKLGLSTQSGCMAPQLLPPIAMVVELFRRCVAEVAPLLQSCTLPPRHINNFIEYQGHRLKLVQKFCHVIDPKTNTVVASRHPVDPMSHAGFEFLHAPFDVAETRLCMADRADAEHNSFLRL